MQKFFIKLLCCFIPIKRWRDKVRAKYKIASIRHLRKIFFKKTGYELNLKDPQTFNEKINWLKFNENTPLMTKCADKYLVREHIKGKGVEETLAKLYGVWDKPEDIHWDDLPNRFVLKTNHDSGSVWIVKTRNQFDKKAFSKEVKKSLKRVYGVKRGEFYYADIPPKIIAEEYLEDESGELIDYKLACYNGVPKYVSVHLNRSVAHQMSFYDLSWNDLNLGCVGFENINRKIPRPKNLKKMIEIGKKLSKEFTFARIDFYVVNDKIYFGEITFWDGSGFNQFTPESWDRKLGSFLNIKISKNKN